MLAHVSNHSRTIHLRHLVVQNDAVHVVTLHELKSVRPIRS
jgi:hypothetical protein